MLRRSRHTHPRTHPLGRCCTAAARPRRHSSPRRTSPRAPTSMSCRSMPRRRWAAATCALPSCSPRARTSTSGLPSTVRAFVHPFILACTHGGCARCVLCSRGLLQPDQHAVRHHHGVLHTTGVPDHERRAQVCARVTPFFSCQYRCESCTLRLFLFSGFFKFFF